MSRRQYSTSPIKLDQLDILVNVISLIIESIVKDSTSDSSNAIACVVQYNILHAGEHVF